MLWHYHDDDVPGPEAAVHLTVNNLPKTTTAVRLSKFIIDSAHANAFTAWKRMGSPASPTADQLATLQREGQLAAEADRTSPAADGSISISASLERHAVKLLAFELSH
jgi:xylan 1,4-beta-xylosidase